MFDIGRHDVLEVGRVFTADTEHEKRGNVAEYRFPDTLLHLADILIRKRKPQTQAACLGKNLVERRSLEVLELVGEQIKIRSEAAENGLLDS